MIAAGRFRAKPTAWGPTKSAKGEAQYAIEFELLEGDDAGNHITWFGGLKGGGFEFTSKALLACGWDGQCEPHRAELAAEVHLVIEHEEYPEGSGEWHAKVKYVNALGDGPTGGLVEKYRMAAEEADAFGREFLARFKTSGLAGKAAARAPQQQPAPARAAAPAARPQQAPRRAAPPPQDDVLPGEPPPGSDFDF